MNSSPNLVFQNNATIEGSNTLLAFGAGTDKINFAVNTGFGTTTASGNVVINGTTGQNFFQIASSTNQNILVVNSNGFLGVGTTTPGSALSVSGSGFFSKYVNTSGNGGGYQIDGNLILQASSTNGNLNVGQNAGAALLAASPDNVSIGLDALQFATTTNSNVAIGWQAMMGSATVGSAMSYGNVAIGPQSMMSITTGGGIAATSNTAVGSSTLRLLTTASGVTAFGATAGQAVTTGGSNSFFGAGAGKAVTNNTGNSFFGANAGVVDTAGSNSAFGSSALAVNSTGANNNAFGLSALGKVTTHNGNSAFAIFALASTTGDNNSGFGFDSGYEYVNTSSASSTFLGAFAGYGSVAGYGGTGITLVGAGTGFNLASSSWNTFLGAQAGFNVTSGSDNILIGSASTTANDNLTSGSDNIKIGDNISFPSAIASGQLDIGNLIYGTGLGVTGSTVSTGNVGVGTSTPGYTFSVLASTSIASRLGANGGAIFVVASSTSATAATNVFAVATSSVTINGSGSVCVISGSLGCSSDARLKTNITPISGGAALTGLSKISGVTYNWSDPTWQRSQQVGVIAQNVLSAFPQLVGAANVQFDGTTGSYYTVNYAGLVSPLISGVNQLNGVFNASAASTSAASILSSYQGTTTPALMIDALGDLSIGTSTATSTTQQMLCLNGQCITGFPFAVFTGSSSPSSATTSPTLAPDFQSALKSMIANFLADTGNGITNLFAKNIYATNVTADTVTANKNLCVGATCITPSQFQAMVAAYQSGQNGAQSQAPAASGTPSGSSTPPVIELSGNNPATVSVGASYTDLGATITGPTPDMNLGITASVDGGATTTMSAIQIDTTVAGVHTIIFSATDQNGLVGTATRLVNVVDPANSSSLGTNGGAAASNASSTDATSTAP